MSNIRQYFHKINSLPTFRDINYREHYIIASLIANKLLKIMKQCIIYKINNKQV